MRTWHPLPAAALLLACVASGPPGCNSAASSTSPSSGQPATTTSDLAQSQSGASSPSNPDGEGETLEGDWFSNVTAATGIDFRHNSGTSAAKPFPAANGSGLAAFDFDLDGRCDLYFATGTPFPLDPSRAEPVNRAYQNLGDLHFADVSSLTGLDHNGYTAGLTVGDYNSDGFPDVYLACYGANVLFQNQGDGTFQRVEQAGVEDQRWATSAAMLDYDNDGWLDLYVCNYAKWTWETNQFCGDRARNVRIYCSPHSVEAETDVLYRNQGDGTFSDVTAATGLAGRAGRAQGVVAADLDNDGLVDLYVGNDLHANSLFMNQGDGSFRDASESSGVAYDFEGNRQAGMGVAAADTNGDGLLELLVTNFQDEHNALYENHGQGLFSDVSAPLGIAADSRPWVGWGTAFADFDVDGRPDVIVTNGHVDDNRHLLGQTAPYAAPPLLWRNLGARFEFVGDRGGAYFRESHVGRGLATADLDNDGDLDVVVSHQDAAPAVLRNESLPADVALSIVVRLIGTRSNRDAVGARLRLETGERTVVQQVTHGGSYLSCHDPRLVLALHDEETPATLHVHWPSGGESKIPNVTPGYQYTLLEPSGDSSSISFKRRKLGHD